MAHQYHVELSNGQSFTVTTEEYHEDHSQAVFARHLLDLVSRVASNVAGFAITRYIYKGRK